MTAGGGLVWGDVGTIGDELGAAAGPELSVGLGVGVRLGLGPTQAFRPSEALGPPDGLASRHGRFATARPTKSKVRAAQITIKAMVIRFVKGFQSLFAGCALNHRVAVSGMSTPAAAASHLEFAPARNDCLTTAHRNPTRATRSTGAITSINLNREPRTRFV